MNDSCVPMHRENQPQRDWSELRGDVALFVLVCVVIAAGLIALEFTRASRESRKAVDELRIVIARNSQALEVINARYEEREPRVQPSSNPTRNAFRSWPSPESQPVE